MNIIEPYVVYRRGQQNVVDAYFKSSIQEVKSINPSHEESMGWNCVALSLLYLQDNQQQNTLLQTFNFKP